MGTSYRLRIQIVLVLGLGVALASVSHDHDPAPWRAASLGPTGFLTWPQLSSALDIEAIMGVIYSGSDVVHSNEEGTKWG